MVPRLGLSQQRRGFLRASIIPEKPAVMGFYDRREYTMYIGGSAVVIILIIVLIFVILDRRRL